MKPLTIILDRLSTSLKKTGITVPRQRLIEAIAFATGLRNSNILVKQLNNTDIGQHTASYQRMLSNTQVSLLDPIADLEFSADVDWALNEVRSARTPMIMSPYGNILRLPKISGPDVEFGTINVQYSITLIIPVITKELSRRGIKIDPYTLSHLASAALTKITDAVISREKLISITQTLLEVSLASLLTESMESVETETFQIATPNGNLIDPQDLPDYYPNSLKNLTSSDLLSDEAINQTRTILASHDFEYILRPVTEKDVENPTIITQI